MRQPERDPFGPIETVVGILLTLTLLTFAALAVILTLSITGHGWKGVTVLGIGADAEACAVAKPGEVPYAYTTSIPGRGGGHTVESEGVDGLRRSMASSRTSQLEICLKEPTPLQQLSAALTPLGEAFLALGATWLVLRATRAGRQHGLFTPVMATRTRDLGWFLIAMSLVYPLVAAAGRGVVLSAAVRDYSAREALYNPDIHLELTLVALGVLAFARILRRAVPLQEEVDTTV